MSTTVSAPVINWNYTGIENTAKVLMKINRNGHQNEETMMNYIRTIAYNYACKCELDGETPTMVGTGGWYVTFVPAESEEYDYEVEVTLMSYVVAKYFEMI
jgi:hypothetical protein